MDQISIKEKRSNDYMLLTISGTLNSYTYTEFQSKVYELIQETNLVLDMSQVTTLSSSGLGVLMVALDDGEEAGHKLYILNPSEIVRSAIDSTGFADMFLIIHSTKEIQ